ncbi:hypothetical protein M8C21_026799 [Ambrosia artemisiifolia]|uniref:Uncharacterized protein n=1 Tax=Ambrosia artemisiifolia TaxID=4212 RepID=A0AAD5C869_AMBAR|nr:hypothetical protein M8C21_026799 [Ambrosia artemisiifolia]
MASILNTRGLALALIALIIVGSSFPTIDARRPYNRVRQLATNYNSPRHGQIAAGCSGGGDGVDHQDQEHQVVHHM